MINMDMKSTENIVTNEIIRLTGGITPVNPNLKVIKLITGILRHDSRIIIPGNLIIGNG